MSVEILSRKDYYARNNYGTQTINGQEKIECSSYIKNHWLFGCTVATLVERVLYNQQQAIRSESVTYLPESNQTSNQKNRKTLERISKTRTRLQTLVDVRFFLYFFKNVKKGSDCYHDGRTSCPFGLER